MTTQDEVPDLYFELLPPEVNESIVEPLQRDVDFYHKTMKGIIETDHIIKDIIEYNNLSDNEKLNYNFKTKHLRDLERELAQHPQYSRLDTPFDADNFEDHKDNQINLIRQRQLNSKIIERSKATMRLIQYNTYQVI